MAVHIQFSNNQIINFAAFGALEIGSLGLGAVALGHPMGAAGAAIFGVSKFFSYVVISLFAKVLIPSIETDNSMLKSAKSAAIFALAFAGGWKLATLCGVNMSLGSAFILSIAGMGIGLVGLGVCTLAYKVFGKSLLSTNPPAEARVSL